VVVLRLGPALAILQPGVGPQADEHDRVAGELLRAETGLGAISVERRPSGRPRLSPPFRELSVSLSYRAGLLLVAFAPENDVGADLEVNGGLGASDPHRLASDHFAPSEAIAVRSRSQTEARDLFLRLWVAKEATLKLNGRGVYDGLAEPDLGDQIQTLMEEGARVSVPASGRIPRAELAVWRPELCGGNGRVYCALAYALP
jgi:4'-phosphopantetheinyl transferase